MGTTEPGDASRERARILVVDDHPILREGLAQLLSHEQDLELCGEAGSSHQALESIATLRPDAAIVDLSLGDAGVSSGLRLIKDIKVRHPALAVLVLSMHDEVFYAERALEAGAMGYMMKDEAPDEVLAALRTVLRDEFYLSPEMSSRVVRRSITHRPEAGVSPVKRLTARQFEVFVLIGRGLGTRQSAEQLHVSVKTVESHCANIKKTLGLKDIHELNRYAILWVKEEGIS